MSQVFKKSSIHKIWQMIDLLARQRFFSIILVGLLSFVGSWFWGLGHGFPIPLVHDEFSYLLAGDTFAHGRLTNPTHPMWIHFESFYELQHPTYMSIYPPAQGFFLGLGQVLLGHPIYGVWFSSALMCAGITWMLYGWVSPRWALVGGLVSVLQFGVFTYWNQSYWGGAVASMGGALIFGALPRIFKSVQIRDALVLGLGLLVLLNSRPLEGFLVALPIGLLVLPWKIRWKGVLSANFIKKIILPLGFVLMITIWGMGAYNRQLTGDARVFPHFLYDRTNRDVPLFLFQPQHPAVIFDHKIMELHQKDYVEKYYLDKLTWNGFLKDMGYDIVRMGMFFLGYPLALPSLAVLLFLLFYRQTSLRFLTVILVLLVTCAVKTTTAKAYSFAPLTCLVVLLIIDGLKMLAGLKLRKCRAGLVFVILLIVLQLFLNIFFSPTMPRHLSLARPVQGASIHLPSSFTREELKEFLIKRGGKYLVIVQYPLTHNYFLEWVYNDADIDHAPIVWARDMDEEHNKELVDYFKDRQVVYIYVYWDKKWIPDAHARQS